MLLTYLNPLKTSVIQVDTLSRGLGAALIQNSKPIVHASKTLTETEQCYANIEQELLAVIFQYEKFCMYIYGFSFIIESDHKPLEMISKKNYSSTSSPTMNVH